MVSLAALGSLPFAFAVKEIVGVDSVEAISPGLTALVTVPKPPSASFPAIWSSGHIHAIEKSEARYLDPRTGRLGFCEIQEDDQFEGRGVLDDGTVVGAYLHRSRASGDAGTPQPAVWKNGAFTIVDVDDGVFTAMDQHGTAYGSLYHERKSDLYQFDTKTFVGRTVAEMPDVGAYPRVMADGSVLVLAGSEYHPETWACREGKISLVRKNDDGLRFSTLPQGRLYVGHKEWTFSATSDIHFESKLIIRSGSQNAEFKPLLPDSPESVGVSCIGPNGSVVFMANWSKPFHNRFFLATPVFE